MCAERASNIERVGGREEGREGRDGGGRERQSAQARLPEKRARKESEGGNNC